MAGQESLLLLLPDPCLLKVLQCCAADDQRSLFSAARAHSRLHEAAVAALSSIAMVIFSPQQLDSVLLYLGKHCRQIDSIDLDAKGDGVFVLHQLPADLQLSTLQLEDFHLQLQPCGGFQGVLGAAVEIAALTQLRLGNCSLLDGEEELAAALAQLPAGLQHLSIDGLWIDDDHPASFPSAVLTPLHMLTHLELADVRPTCSDPDGHFLQPLQAMTRLVHLRLSTDPPAHTFPASVVSGSLSLTFLTLSSCEIEPEILAGKTSLRHVSLSSCSVLGGAPGVRQLLAHLQELQELTQLFMASRFQEIHEDIPPATAFSALTASSKLQHLDLNGCTLPSGVWQHIFPANRQLPHLTSLDINGVGHLAEPPSPLTAAALSHAALACSFWTCGPCCAVHNS